LATQAIARPRHDLLDEHHAAADLAVNDSLHVEAQVDLFEVAVKRNRAAEHPGVRELKSHDADEAPAAPEIQLRAGRDQRIEHPAIHLVVDHRKVQPARRQER
jgi:hypothetical protein